MLLEHDVEPPWPLAPHADPAHPRQLLERGAYGGEVERQKITLELAPHHVLDLAAGDVGERAADRDLAQLEQRLVGGELVRE